MTNEEKKEIIDLMHWVKCEAQDALTDLQNGGGIGSLELSFTDIKAVCDKALKLIKKAIK